MLSVLSRALAPRTTAHAHCDIPCGVYDPAQARIEAESIGFHQRVRDSFLELASADPEHYVVVDARMPRDEIAAIVRDRITPVLPLADRRHDIDEPVGEGVDA